MPRSDSKRTAARAASSEAEQKRHAKLTRIEAVRLKRTRRADLASAYLTKLQERAVIVFSPLSDRYAPDWEQHVRADVSFDAYCRRMSELARLIETRGGFKHSEAMRAIVGPYPDLPYPDSQQAVASWLRGELKKLRDGERKNGAAPARRGDTLSRLQVADLAIAMLEALSDEIGDELLCLFQELVDIDRHRRVLSEARSEQFGLAVAFEGQAALQGREFGVRELARIVSVSPATITAWRRSAQYQDAVASEKRVWGVLLREYFGTIKAEDPDLPEPQAFTRAFRMYGESLPGRRAKWQPGPEEK
jgi:hypothetical protein